MSEQMNFMEAVEISRRYYRFVMSLIILILVGLDSKILAMVFLIFFLMLPAYKEAKKNPFIVEVKPEVKDTFYDEPTPKEVREMRD